jgi:hypothetical protein
MSSYKFPEEIENLKKFPLNRKYFEWDPNEVYDEYLGELDGFKIWKVYGDYIMICMDADFVCGGNGYAKNYIPKDEIWLDRSVSQDDIVYVVIHEMDEVRHMELGWTYNEAHSNANQVEWEIRKATYVPLEEEKANGE